MWEAYKRGNLSGKSFSLTPAKPGMNTEFKAKPKWSSTAVLFQE
jgi:hypothetical protein